MKNNKFCPQCGSRITGHHCRQIRQVAQPFQSARSWNNAHGRLHEVLFDPKYNTFYYLSKTFYTLIRKTDKERIAKFYEDRNVLTHKDIDIAKKMKMLKSNYSNYVNGRNPITDKFLKRFYSAFGEEISEILEKRGQRATGEAEGAYEKIMDRDNRIAQLEKKMMEFEGKYELLLESHHKISSEIRILEMKMDRVEERLDKIEILLARLVERDLVPANGNPTQTAKPAKPPKKQKKAPEDLQGS